MKRKIMACILAAALGITGVSFPTAAKTVSVGKNVKNITVNVKNPLDELRAQEAAMQQQEELEEEENMPEQDLIRLCWITMAVWFLHHRHPGQK